MSIEGGCFCGAIRYEIDEGKHVVANCHCTLCRKTSAAPFVTWMVVPVFEDTKLPWLDRTEPTAAHTQAP